MNTTKKINFPNLAGFAFGMVLSLGLLFLLVGCAGAPRWGTWSKNPTPAQIQAGLSPRDSYVYIPAYETYYNTTAARYVFPSNLGWVTQVDPPQDVSVGMLLASPSVAMTFTDAPARHHAAMARLYPRNWGQGTVVMAFTR